MAIAEMFSDGLYERALEVSIRDHFQCKPRSENRNFAKNLVSRAA
jgi:hypothetical protein